MKLDKVVLILGSQTKLGKILGVSAPVISGWRQFNQIPDKHRTKLKPALKRSKAAIDKAFDELMGE